MLPGNSKAPALLIGRWVTPHAGHKALIEDAIRLYGSVILAIRDTDEEPPAAQRGFLLGQLLGSAEGIADIIIIPDISAVVYGRDVGYHITKITTGLEHVSGRNIRESDRE